MSKIPGGNVTLNKAGARVKISAKSALIAVPTPSPKRDSVPVKATSMDQALREMSVDFKVDLRKTDGTVEPETIEIRDLEDFDEHSIIDKSKILSTQKRQLAFLFEFQYELQNNPTLLEEMKELLKSDKKKELISFLKRLQDGMRSKNSEFINLLKRS